MRQYPYLGAFAVKAFYEKDPAVRPHIMESYQKLLLHKANDTLKRLDSDQFIEGLDLRMMYRDMYLASEGYLWELIQQGDALDIDKMESGFTEMIAFWKKTYLRKEG